MTTAAPVPETVSFECRASPEMMAAGIAAVTTAQSRAGEGGKSATRWLSAAWFVGSAVLTYLALQWLLGYWPALEAILLTGVCIGAGAAIIGGQWTTRRHYRRMARNALERDVPWTFTLGPGHVAETSPSARYWFALTEVLDVAVIPEASVVICPGLGFVLPDKDLPEGLTPEALRAEIKTRAARACAAAGSGNDWAQGEGATDA